MDESRDVTFIQSAVPAQRGPVRHYEHTNETAFTRFKGDVVTEIHTPQTTLKRIHEAMHARHTDPQKYAGIHGDAFDIVEDCRLHIKHWPWDKGETPNTIKADAIETIKGELAITKSGFSDFAIKLRAHAVYRGLSIPSDDPLYPAFDSSDAIFAKQILDLIEEGEEVLAAKLIEKVFLEKPKPRDPYERDDDVEYDKDGEPIDIDREGKHIKGKIRVLGKIDKTPEKKPEPTKKERIFLGDKGRMEIIDLEKVDPTQSADAGFRLASSGARLYRPALRRPILSPRLFLKKSPYEPVGVICFDSSGSMAVTQQILSDCCQRAPSAVVGYYEGMDGAGKGWLWIYARDGMRARETPLKGFGGNAVDGEALDWMLTFDRPRILVTDREFCGAHDSEAQLRRLRRLEGEEEIKVYTSFNAFKMAYPRQTTY